MRMFGRFAYMRGSTKFLSLVLYVCVVREKLPLYMPPTRNSPGIILVPYVTAYSAYILPKSPLEKLNLKFKNWCYNARCVTNLIIWWDWRPNTDKLSCLTLVCLHGTWVPSTGGDSIVLRRAPRDQCGEYMRVKLETTVVEAQHLQSERMPLLSAMKGGRILVEDVWC